MESAIPVTKDKDHYKRMADKSHALAKDKTDAYGKGATRYVPSIISSSDLILTLNEASDRYRVDVTTLRSWIRKGVLPHIRVGPPPGLIRLRDADLARVVTPEDQIPPMTGTVGDGK